MLPHDYSDIYKEEDEILFKGITYTPDLSEYSDYFKTHTITEMEEFRPDKIANKLWYQEDAAWVLNEINYFQHGIKEYIRGKEIKYLERDILVNLGIL